MHLKATKEIIDQLFDSEFCFEEDFPILAIKRYIDVYDYPYNDWDLLSQSFVNSEIFFATSCVLVQEHPRCRLIQDIQGETLVEIGQIEEGFFSWRVVCRNSAYH